MPTIKDVKELDFFVESFCTRYGGCTLEFNREYQRKLNQLIDVVFLEYGAVDSDRLGNLDASAELGPKSELLLWALKRWLADERAKLEPPALNRTK